MGLNVSIQTIETPYREHPDWDDGRYSGDRSIFEIMDAVPGQYHNLNECDWVWRPADFDAFRSAAWPPENLDRWTLLADLLEADPQWWIYMGA